MRMLMKVTMPVERGNKLAKDGKLGETLEGILADLRPEAAYFIEMDGHRTGIIVVDIADPSQIPMIAEPFFLALEAHVELHPAMTPEDLAKAGPSIEAAAKKHG